MHLTLVQRALITNLLPLLIVISILTGGCVQTAMLPADRLEDGETRWSLGLDEPGAVILPWFNAQVTRGVGAVISPRT